MNIEKYTDRAKGFLQAAQTIALREGNQQFTPEHLLKALLDDNEGMAAGLIDRAGGQSRVALQLTDQAVALGRHVGMESYQLRSALRPPGKRRDRKTP